MPASGTLRDQSRTEDNAAAPAADRVYGVIDVVRANKIAGWAIDRADAQAALDIDILREGRLVCRVRADRPRRDLEANGLGTGRYGFTATIEPPIEPGFEFTLSAVARAADGKAVALKRVEAAAEPGEPLRRLVESLYMRLGELARRDEAPRLQEVARLEDLLARLEVAQARIDSSLNHSASERIPGRGLKVLVAVSLAVGLGSLLLGVLSMWQP